MKGRLSDRFLFGTDLPMFDPADLLSELDGLGLPDDVKEKVLVGNAAELLGMTQPSPY